MPGYLTNSKNHANEQRHTYSAIGQAVGVHLRTVPHWVAAGEPQGKEVSIEGGQRGALPGEHRSLTSEQESLIRTLLLDCKRPEPAAVRFPPPGFLCRRRTAGLKKVVRRNECDASTAETGHGLLQAHWRDGEAEGMRLCASCLGYAMATLKESRRGSHMFDDAEPQALAPAALDTGPSD